MVVQKCLENSLVSVMWPSGDGGEYCDLILEVLSRRVIGECGGFVLV